ncbi:MAG: hypothetical protein ING84_07085 [Cytophagales bacterium]|jgi:hypothetical protein|nr:hypothetical protein [Cytophagales bacterium]MCA6365534.1 hypothetical protein [Cytophagales bacterium]MCA6373674.1 hypothetical protein [Cytophagales bacterium]MCA6374253.1 hypothetical protein [Cytophagales bacterium]MCA6383244.1 hypothetical protein [Cytophagales bacterium]
MKVIKGIDKGIIELELSKELEEAIAKLREAAIKSLSASKKAKRLWNEIRQSGNLPESIENLTPWDFNSLASLPEKDKLIAMIEAIQKHTPFDRKGKRKEKPSQINRLTPLEKKLFDFCKKKKIDLTKSKGNSIDKIHYEAEAKKFKNLNGEKKLARSTVGKMLAKIRPQ